MVLISPEERATARTAHNRIRIMISFGMRDGMEDEV